MPTTSTIARRPAPATRHPDYEDLPALLAAAGHGDQDAWDVLVDRFTGLLWSVARSYRLGRDDAADVVQKTWLRLLENLTTIRRPQGLPKWLATTASREALAVIRTRRRDVLTGDLQTMPGINHTVGPDVGAGLLRDEQDAQLRSLFLTLPERTQRLLQLLAVDQLEYAEVAAALDMPIGSIGPTRMRALATLRAAIQTCDYPFDPPRRLPMTRPPSRPHSDRDPSRVREPQPPVQ